MVPFAHTVEVLCAAVDLAWKGVAQVTINGSLDRMIRLLPDGIAASGDSNSN